ncbi:YidH family protein [Nocardioides sp. Soil796]|uniref:YidH family protein n=1 Tax=Nocardioides sp. Soil796 TaxID=1736412 RepID=UPI000B0DD198|nr:DUF202 domain-containing protein [Nocardioides sp. Soil796]
MTASSVHDDMLDVPDTRRPAAVYAEGREPDPRFSLANERTFLAWIRTTLALLAGAAAVHALDLGVPEAVARTTAALLALAGFGCAVHAWLGWARTEKALRRGHPLPSNSMGIVLAIAVAAVSIVMVVVGLVG